MEGRVYKLYIPGLEEFCYVGSTESTLKKRFAEHRCGAINESQTKSRSSVLFTDGNEPVIELLEEGTYTSKEELHARERYWIGRFPECLNHNIPGRTWKERWTVNREHNLSKHKEWLEANKEQEAAKKKVRREADSEAARAKDKESRERRKTQIAAAKKTKVVCPNCNKEMNKGSLWLHNNTVHKTG